MEKFFLLHSIFLLWELYKFDKLYFLLRFFPKFHSNLLENLTKIIHYHYFLIYFKSYFFTPSIIYFTDLFSFFLFHLLFIYFYFIYFIYFIIFINLSSTIFVILNQLYFIFCYPYVFSIFILSILLFILLLFQ